MKAVVQRVSEASVSVEGEAIGQIGCGLMVLLCAEAGDDETAADFLARKISKMRIFPDAAGKMNRSLKDIDGSVLAISQFTLAGDWKKGNRPGFSRAAEPKQAAPLFEHFCAQVKAEGVPVEKGVFGAEMQVSLINDGPVTIPMDTRRD